MNLPALIWKELRHHRVNALLSVGGLAMAVALLTVVRMTTAAAERETRRVMRDLGFNLRIIPRDTDMDFFWAQGHADKTMPVATVKKLAAQHGLFLTFNHLTPALERRLDIAGKPTLITGIGPSIVGPGEAKQPMGFVIPRGKVFLGSEVAARLGAKTGSEITLEGRPFSVARVLAESGTEEDIRVFTSLEDAQALLGLPDQINEIKAIDCLCLTADQDPLTQLRKVLEEALPEARVLQLRSLADARAKQRQMTERYAAFAVPAALLGGAVWVGVLAVLNVRERRAEIGLWRALGCGSGRLAALFLGKAMVLGLVGAAVGYAAGTGLALRVGPEIFQGTARALAPDFKLLLWATIGTPLFAALASFLPAMMAVAQDPADSLRAD